MNEAAENLSAAIDCGRTDIVRAVVSALEKGEVRDVNNSLLKLEHVLNNTTLTSVGSILHYAAQAGQADIVRALLASGADPGVHNSEGKTPLDITTIERVRNVFNEELLQCVAHSNIGRACQLLAAGVSVNFQDSPTSLNTPLHWAASFGNKDSVQCLCKRGANVNLQNIHGATALHDAVNRGDPSVVGELISHGASKDIVAETGSFANKTPLDLAKTKGSLTQFFEGSKKSMEKDVATPSASPVTTRSFEPLKLTNVASPMTNGASAPSEVSMESASNSTPITASSLPVPPRPLLSGPDDSRLQKLWPQPRKVIPRQGDRFLPLGIIKVYASRNDGEFDVIWKAWHLQKPSIEALGFNLNIETLAAGVELDVPCILCEVNSKLMPDSESYKLSVSQKIVKIQSSDRAGLQYAITTFIQLLKACWDEGIPPLQLHDKPCLKQRGVLLDASKGRVPTLESMKLLAAQLASLKINQIQLYTRATVPDEPEERWQFPQTRSCLMELDEFCWSMCIELVPTLDVHPRVAYHDLPDLYYSFQMYISCFTHAKTIGIGPRLSSFLVDLPDDGLPNVEDAYRLLSIPSSCTLQLCSFGELVERVDQFPTNTVLAEYGFQADYDFERRASLYEESGVAFCVVSGTAAWNSLSGCPEATIGNVQAAVHSAIAHGALGMVVSHWSGAANVTHLPFMWTGLLPAAGFAWNSNIDLGFVHRNLAELLNLHVFEDVGNTVGQVMVELGRAETYLIRCSRGQPGSDLSDLPSEKGSTLYQLLSHPDEVSLDSLPAEAFTKTMRHIRKCQGEISRCELRCSESRVILEELQLTTDLMLAACRFLDLIETYRQVWLGRCLPIGLPESLLVLSGMLKQFVPNESAVAHAKH